MKKVKLFRSLGKDDKMLLAVPEKDGNEGDILTVSDDGYEHLVKTNLCAAVDDEPKPVVRGKAKQEPEAT